MLTLQSLQKIMPNAGHAASTYLAPLIRLMPEYGIDTPRRQAHFLAQVAQESGEFRYTSENLNYSANGLIKTFRKYFPSTVLAQQYERRPERIANRVYADRLGNGSEQSGDGWRYRGRGLIQLTGRENYESYFAHLRQKGIPVPSPDAIATDPTHAVRVACWYWQSRDLSRYADSTADSPTIRIITIKVNGGTNGITEREMYYRRARLVL